jgi:hypothetical protein
MAGRVGVYSSSSRRTSTNVTGQAVAKILPDHEVAARSGDLDNYNLHRGLRAEPPSLQQGVYPKDTTRDILGT